MRLGKILVIDPRIAGAAGDMFVAALLDLGASKQRLDKLAELLVEHLEFLEEFKVEVRDVKKGAIRAKKLELKAVEHRNHHNHHHGHHHEYTALDMRRDAEQVSRELGLSERGISGVLRAMDLLIDAECSVHGVPREEAHFHELASSDTLFDIIGTYALLEELGFLSDDSKIYSLPAAVGSGRIRMAHGEFASPAPAVLEIARRTGLPLTSLSVNGELLTPTGAAIIASVSHRFLNTLPFMIVERIGHGAGEREFEGIPNVLRLISGRDAVGGELEPVSVLETNIDDTTGEVLGHVVERMLDAGALDVQVIPSTSKKSRPSHLLQVIVKPGMEQEIARRIMLETGSLGVRVYNVFRYVAQRSIEEKKVVVRGREFRVRVKKSVLPDGSIVNIKPEYDDAARIARELGIPLREVLQEILSKI